MADQEPHSFLFNSFPASGEFCRLLMMFANKGPRSARQKIGADLDPSSLTPDVIPERVYWIQYCKKISADRNMRHFIWEFTVRQIMHLGVTVH